LTGKDADRVDELIYTRRRVRRRETLYYAGDAFVSLYAVRSSSFKTNLTLEDGRHQVTAFHMAGERSLQIAVSGGALIADEYAHGLEHRQASGAGRTTTGAGVPSVTLRSTISLSWPIAIQQDLQSVRVTFCRWGG
jgi:hypothetical protein